MNSPVRLSSQVSSFPVSLRPVRIALPLRKLNFRVNISSEDRKIQRFKDEVNDFYDQKLKDLKPIEKKQLDTEWIKKNMIDKWKKVDVVEFGYVLGKGKFPLTKFMLVQIGLLEEDKEKKKKEDDEKLKKKKKEDDERLKKKKEDDEKLKKKKEEEKKARKEKENEDYENHYEEIRQQEKAKKEMEDEEAENYYEQEKAKKEKKDEEALLLYVALWWALTK